MADDDYQHYERLEDRDHDGGEWIGGEYFHRGKRQRRQQTKEDQLYGVFAADSDEEEERRGRRKGERGQADYAAPVAFVASGIVGGDPPPEVKPELKEDDGQPGGLGFSGGGFGFSGAGLGAQLPASNGGLGFAPTRGGLGAGGGGSGGIDFASSSRAVKAEDGDDEDEEFLPTAFGRT